MYCFWHCMEKQTNKQSLNCSGSHFETWMTTVVFWYFVMYSAHRVTYPFTHHLTYKDLGMQVTSPACCNSACLIRQLYISLKYSVWAEFELLIKSFKFLRSLPEALINFSFISEMHNPNTVLNTSVWPLRMSPFERVIRSEQFLFFYYLSAPLFSFHGSLRFTCHSSELIIIESEFEHFRVNMRERERWQREVLKEGGDPEFWV